MGNSNTGNSKMGNSNTQERIGEFVQASGADAIPRMHRMLHVDRSITDINIKDRTYSDRTALHYQSLWAGCLSIG